MAEQPVSTAPPATPDPAEGAVAVPIPVVAKPAPEPAPKAVLPISQAVEEVAQVVESLKGALEQMEEALELVELAERQKLGDEREIESLRRALRQLQSPRGGRGGHREGGE
ncbi:MAG: hypothetical protein KGJ60_16195 [Verrucomicrobiota bacterium]|nr:hypothetical protein [Verrucomicrobiota bacterium]